MKKQAIVLSNTIHKGGAGKTTFFLNLAAQLAKMDNRVLLIDLDSQGHSSLGFGFTASDWNYTIVDVLKGKKKAKEVIVQVVDNLYLLPCNKSINRWEEELGSIHDPSVGKDNLNHIKRVLEPLRAIFDYILIDSPPSMGKITKNILVATDYVVMPFVPETFVTDGIVTAMDTIEEMKEHNTKLKVLGFVCNAFTKTLSYHNKCIVDVLKYARSKKTKLFANLIPRSAYYSNTTREKAKPLVLADPNNSYTKILESLTEEIVESIQEEEAKKVATK